MPVTDDYRRVLLERLQDSSPAKLKIVEDELAHQRDMDRAFIVTERWTMIGALALALVVIGVAVFFAAIGVELAAAVAIVADVGGVVYVAVRRSYFIPSTA